MWPNGNCIVLRERRQAQRFNTHNVIYVTFCQDKTTGTPNRLVFVRSWDVEASGGDVGSFHLLSVVTQLYTYYQNCQKDALKGVNFILVLKWENTHICGEKRSGGTGGCGTVYQFLFCPFTACTEPLLCPRAGKGWRPNFSQLHH